MAQSKFRCGCGNDTEFQTVDLLVGTAGFWVADDGQITWDGYTDVLYDTGMTYAVECQVCGARVSRAAIDRYFSSEVVIDEEAYKWTRGEDDEETPSYGYVTNPATAALLVSIEAQVQAFQAAEKVRQEVIEQAGEEETDNNGAKYLEDILALCRKAIGEAQGEAACA